MPVMTVVVQWHSRYLVNR